MSSRESGDVTDFFDLTKSFRANPGKGFVSRQSRLDAEKYAREAEAFWANDKKPTNRGEKYHVKYQNDEMARMAQTVSPPDKKGRIAVTSAMSALDDDTIAGSSVYGGQSVAPRSRDEIAAKELYTRSLNSANVLPLPVDHQKSEILEKIYGCAVTVISGSTGCGKSTRIPQFILDDEFMRNKLGAKILVTQPRKLAAQSIAKRVAAERGWELGRLVGYKVGLDKEHASRETRLLYVTTGMFVKMLVSAQSLAEFTHVVIDEVHEREKDMDFVLLLCRRFITTNSRHVKLVLMSATMNVDKMCDYFSWPLALGQSPTCQANHLKIVGKMEYSTSVYYLNDLVDRSKTFEYPEEEKPGLFPSCVDMCKKIIVNLSSLEKNQSRGAVLVFLPGEMEIKTVKNELMKNGDAEKNEWWILPLHSRMPFEDSQQIFRPSPTRRKIILSTNIAESSVTIPDILYVIDFCLTKKLVTDSQTHYASLKLTWADKNSCTQRKGRAGRVACGRVFRLLKKEFYDSVLPEEHVPELQRAPIDKIILDTKMLDMGSPKELLALAIDPPELEKISLTVTHLKELGALLPTTRTYDIVTEVTESKYFEDDGDITVLGEIMSSLPIDVRLAKLVIIGHLFDVLDECIVIAAGLANKSIFTYPFEEKHRAYANKLMWADRSFSDCLAVLHAYTVWNNKRQMDGFVGRDSEENWCRARYLQLNALREVEKTIKEIQSSLEQLRIRRLVLPNRPDRQRSQAQDNNYLLLKVAIFGAFYPNYFVRNHGNLDLKAVHRAVNNRDPMTTLYLSGFPIDQHKYGDLYANQVKDIFKDVQQNRDLIDVEFDSSKILVTFLQPTNSKRIELSESTRIDASYKDNLTHNIIHQVYVGMKLASMPRERLTMHIFNTQEAENKLAQYVENSSHDAAFSYDDVASYETIGHVDPPGLDDDTVKMTVMYTDSPSSFWATYHADLKRFNRLITALSRVDVDRCDRARKGSVQVGHVYLAPFEDSLYRARVEAIEPGCVSVFFIDYGNVDEVGYADLIPITRSLMDGIGDGGVALVQIPALAFECSLAFIKPNPIRAGNGRWDKEANQAFESLLPTDVVAKVYSVTTHRNGPLVTVTLYKDANGTSINHKFKSMADSKGRPFAENTAEGYLKEMSNRVRRDASAMSDADKKLMEARQRALFANSNASMSMSSLARALPDVRGMGRVRLKGPYHPLTYSLAGVHPASSSKKVVVEAESVNSVLLDDQPDDIVDQWAVAAHVGLRHSETELVARSTTILPNKIGFGAMLTMLFAPSVEMRVDKDRQRYTGCIAGLGHHDIENEDDCYEGQLYRRPSFPKSYNRDHDIEISFDGFFDNEDITNINRVRFYICLALSRNPVDRLMNDRMTFREQRNNGFIRMSIEDTLIQCQDQIKASFDRLVNRTRPSISKERFKYEGEWGYLKLLETLDNEETGFLEKTGATDSNQYFLKMIDKVKFKRNWLDRAEEIIKDLNALVRIRDDPRGFANNPIQVTCPLCPVFKVFRSVSEVADHLKRDEHLDNALQFRESLWQHNDSQT